MKMTSLRLSDNQLAKLALAFLIPLAALGATAADSLTMADFNHSIKLMVNGYTGSETLTNFPVLVRVSETGLPGFHYADMSAINVNGKALGYDLAFFAEDGTRLECEQDTWDIDKTVGVTGEQLVWVKLPTMEPGTMFYMCYNVGEGKYVTNDKPWGDYVGVWHMGESGNGTVTILDSTANGLDATATSVSYAQSAGRIGGARTPTRNGNNKDTNCIQVDLSDSTKRTAVNNLNTDANGHSFTVSMWVQPKQYSGNGKPNSQYLVGRKSNDNTQAWAIQYNYDLLGKNSIDYSKLRVWGSDSSDATVSVIDFDDSVVSSTASESLDKWYKYDVVYSGSSVTFYLNGGTNEYCVVTSELSEGTAANGSGNLLFLAGTSNNGTREFCGDMDEVRLRSGVVSADWVKADFDTVNDTTFVVVAPVDELAITWANAASETPGVAAVTHDSVVFGGTVLCVGETSACDIEYKIWPATGSEPEDWTALTNDLATGDSFAVNVSGLTKLTTYNYKLRAVNGAEDPVEASGAFTTEDILSIDWSETSGTNGFSTISYDFAIATGEVTKLGDASYCDIQIKLWGPGEMKPAEWTTVYENLGLNESFNAAITNLLPGTTYDYELSALGDDDERSDILAGRFTTEGEDGEVIGSQYTHYFYDGTNAYWVANDFERYLEFTVTGYTGTETLKDFPVLVEVRKKDTNGFTYDDFYHYDGKDIAFVDEKGHIIPHEIDTWNRSGMSLFWVRLPEMHNGTKFTMCYRSPLVDPLPDVGNTFEKYVGVWHMNEPGDGVVHLKDSTTNDFETETHAASTAYGSGQIGGARRVAQQPGSAASYGRIIAFDHDDILRTGVGTVFTFSGWYKLHETPPKWPARTRARRICRARSR